MKETIYLLKEFWAFAKEKKKWWILPIVFMLLLVGLVFVANQATGAVGTFIYALF